MNSNGQILLGGSRYEYSGKILPYLTKFVEAQGVDFNVHSEFQKSMPVDPPRSNQDFIEGLNKHKVYATQEDDERIFHSHGHTLQEMYALKFGRLERVVDVVVYPINEGQVEEIMKLANEYNVLLVPYGGGTNVTHSLSLERDEDRLICSVDMSKMNHVRVVNLTSMTAIVEAGIAGRDLEKELSRYGVCCGHEPDSVEFSTLGGWISTKASGMKKNIYGNIEDIVITVRIVTPIGTWEKPCTAPRMSTGPDANNFIIGHEGLFGIITQATIKVKNLPEVKDYDSVIFPNFSVGSKFMYECGIRQIRPASIRLLDNLQFKFGLALKPAGGTQFKAFIDAAKKYYITKIKKFDPDHMCACTLVFEGSKEVVELQKKEIMKLAKKFEGLRAGEENGKRGYFLTFTIAYIRDFGMEYGLFAESFEASVPWENLNMFITNVPVSVI
jgi:alkyldihydroxyacetonephosphate synthase